MVMDIEKIVQKLAESPEFAKLVQIQAERELAAQAEQARVAEVGREIKRARMMEPSRDEGEWLLNNSAPAGDE